MNCLDCRREMLAQPDALSGEARAHISECEACRETLAQTTELDRRIAEGIAVPVPAGLAEGILGRRRGVPVANRSYLALAAALVLAIAAGALLWLGRDDPLARAGIDFVVDQEVGAILAAKPADPGVLARVTQALHVRLPTRAVEVRYIGTCPFEGTIAHHVVVITPEGKATLLLFPEKAIHAQGGASARGLRSVAKPAGAGSVVIVGSGETLDQLEDIVTKS